MSVLPTEHYCSLEGYPVVTLVKNYTTGFYQREIQGSSSNPMEEDGFGSTRRRRQQEALANIFVPSSSSSRSLHEGGKEDNELDDFRFDEDYDPDYRIQARFCSCAPLMDDDEDYPGETYCPIGTRTCRVLLPYIHRLQLEIVCVDHYENSWARYSFPVSFFLFLFLAAMLCFSPMGFHVKSLVQRAVCCWSEARYQEVLERELERAQELVLQRQQRARARNWWAHIALHPAPVVTRTTARPGATARSPRVAVLKTMLYHCEDQAAPATVDEEDRHADQQEVEEGHVDCAICLLNLQDGDRVGDLQCGHIFHVDCLKTWIRRKNHCPLCKASNLATSREKGSSTDMDTSSDENSAGDSGHGSPSVSAAAAANSPEGNNESDESAAAAASPPEGNDEPDEPATGSPVTPNDEGASVESSSA